MIADSHDPHDQQWAAELMLSMDPWLTLGRTRKSALQAIQEAGLRVPDDISIIGSDDILLSRYTSPSLTTVRIPRDELGRMAFQSLLKMHNSKSRRGAKFTVETELVVRRSTGPAAETAL